MQGPRAVPRGEEGPREEAEEGAEEGGAETPAGGGRGGSREPAGPALGRPAGPGLPLQVGGGRGCRPRSATRGRAAPGPLAACLCMPSGVTSAGLGWPEVRRTGGAAGGDSRPVPPRCVCGRLPALWSALCSVSPGGRPGTLKVAGDSVSPSHQNPGPPSKHPGDPPEPGRGWPVLAANVEVTALHRNLQEPLGVRPP